MSIHYIIHFTFDIDFLKNFNKLNFILCIKFNCALYISFILVYWLICILHFTFFTSYYVIIKIICINVDMI